MRLEWLRVLCAVALSLGCSGQAMYKAHLNGDFSSDVSGYPLYDSVSVRAQDTFEAGYAAGCGNAFRVDAGESKVLTVPTTNGVPNGNAPWSLAFYVKVDTTGVRSALFHFGGCGAGNREGLTVGMVPAGGGARWRPTVDIHHGGDAFVLNVDLDVGVWYRLALVWKTNSDLLFFVNPTDADFNGGNALIDMSDMLEGAVGSGPVSLNIATSGASIAYGDMPGCTGVQTEGTYLIDEVVLHVGTPSIGSLTVCDAPDTGVDLNPRVFYAADFDSSDFRSEATTQYNIGSVDVTAGFDTFPSGFGGCGLAYGPVGLAYGKILTTSAGSTDLPSGDDSWTLSFYIKVGTIGLRDVIVGFGKCRSVVAREAFVIGMEATAGNRWSPVVSLLENPASLATSRWVASSIELTADEWHRLVITYGSGGVLKIWADPSDLTAPPSQDMTALLAGGLALQAAGGFLSFGESPTCTGSREGTFTLDNVQLIAGAVTDISSLSLTCPSPLNECNAVNIMRCTDGGNQYCDDPDKTTAGTDDWVCKCDTGYSGTDGMQNATTCTADALDECNAVNIMRCTDGGNQYCDDPFKTAASTDDWVCKCDTGYSGTDGMQNATTCIEDALDECDDVNISSRCLESDHQRCADDTPTATQTGDWVCRCVTGYTGEDGDKGVTTCSNEDECDNATNAATCTTNPNQRCHDGSAAPDDWVCRCDNGYVGEVIPLTAITCVLGNLNECDGNTACPAASHQRCYDPVPDSTSTGDWQCECVDGFTGVPVNQSEATCTAEYLNECDDPDNANECEDAPDQKCADDTPSADQVGDWVCRCKTGYTGPDVERDATSCERIPQSLDECIYVVNVEVCARGANQACFDPNPWDTDEFRQDWVCRCNAGYFGDGGNMTAITCVLEDLDECADPEIANRCPAERDQECHDPNPSSTQTEDWQCHCADGFTGAPGQQAAAEACLYAAPGALFECIETCATCANETCAQHDQVCTDPEPVEASLGDWMCLCRAPAEGPAMTGRATSCRIHAVGGATRGPTGNVNVVGQFIAVLGGSPGGAAGAGRLGIVRGINCEVDDIDLPYDEPLDRDYHPFGNGIGPADVQYLLGATIMNPIFVLAFAVVFGGIAVLLQKVNQLTWAEGACITSFPGVLYIPYAFVLQGTSLASSRLLFNPTRSGGFAALGAAVLIAAAVCIPILVWKMVVRRVAEEARGVDDPRMASGDDAAVDDDEEEPEGSVGGAHDIAPLTGAKRKLYGFVFGKEILVSTRGESYFCEHYGVVFDSMYCRYAWVTSMELITIVLLSFFANWATSNFTACCIRNFIITLILAAFFALLAYLRPFIAPMDNLLSIGLAGVTFLATFVLSLALAVREQGDGALTNFGAALLWASEVWVQIKIICDVLSALYSVLIGRKRVMRARARHADLGVINLEEAQMIGEGDKEHAYGDVGELSISLVRGDSQPNPLQDAAGGDYQAPPPNFGVVPLGCVTKKASLLNPPARPSSATGGGAIASPSAAPATQAPNFGTSDGAAYGASLLGGPASPSAPAALAPRDAPPAGQAPKFGTNDGAAFGGISLLGSPSAPASPDAAPTAQIPNFGTSDGAALGTSLLGSPSAPTALESKRGREMFGGRPAAGFSAPPESEMRDMDDL
eukprot:TRINITY_DN2121_c0_g1_i1.p1 TRINITY_DN2121_c0_g1~~TRINITY_DN2121_c0_g1_i1.p1  ORF type:complete len:1639 (+),score=204.65 TRINITY_DN2121_c0_g1_i1:54-4970(+)